MCISCVPRGTLKESRIYRGVKGMGIKRRIDAVDGKIIALFEKRMLLVKKAAAGMDKFDIREEKRRQSFETADKTVRYACDARIIAYTEELVNIMLCFAVKYQKSLINKKAKP